MKSLLNAAHFANEGTAIEYVEARLWPNGPVCPHCGVVGEATRMKGKTTRLGLWNCRACRKPFTVKMRTVFESSHVPLHVWLQVIYLFCSSKKGFATRQIQRTLGCSMKTAWFLGMRVREAMTELGIDGPLGGENQVVEIDETYVGGKEANKHKSKRRTDGARGPVGKAPVVALVERDGRVRSFHVPNVTAQSLKPIIVANVNKATYLMTDDSAIYPAIGREFGGHGSVNHSAGEYVRATFWHTNTVENYFSIFKRGVYGCYFHVSEAHLHRYGAEFDFRHNYRQRLGYDDVARADKLLAGVKGKRLTYQTTRFQERLDTPPF
jgi:transposase-like protein